MLLDRYFSFNQKIIISLISASIWIYYRTLGCYKMLPRKSYLSIFIIIVWMYLNYYEPLVVPIGLLILYIYSIIYKDNNFKL